ncbi:MAG: hypothetical protein ACOCXZ_01840 [Chloroflexota bacterium]
MLRNRLLMILLLGFVLIITASPTLAQQTNDINFNDIVEALGPRQGQALLFDILLYLIFFIGLINTVLIPDKQLLVSLLNYAVLALVVISKLLIDVVNDGGEFFPSAILESTDFAVLPINAAIFIFPLLMAGLLRSVKGKRSNALFPSLLMGLLGGAYFFMFWAIEQNDPSQRPQPGDFEERERGTLLWGIGVMMAANWTLLRARFTLWRKARRDERQPHHDKLSQWF